ncbi:hypothetical protein, partial [Paralcaligenes ginsengisoli]
RPLDVPDYTAPPTLRRLYRINRHQHRNAQPKVIAQASTAYPSLKEAQNKSHRNTFSAVNT